MKRFVLIILILLSLSGCFDVTYKEEKALPNNSKGIIYADDFSDPESGWDRFQNDTGATDYTNAGYMIFIKKENFIKWSNLSRVVPEDLRIEVDVSKQYGPDDNAFGVLCRYQDPENFYYFLISSDGFGGIGQRVNGKLEIISSTDGKLEPISSINQGDAANHLRVDCVGDNLTMYVNGNQVLQVTDGTFSSGSIGLVSRTYDIGGTGILFSQLAVLKP
ncbi:hypothetical protein ACFLXB_08455 [Chloroflexota bacterium]